MTSLLTSFHTKFDTDQVHTDLKKSESTNILAMEVTDHLYVEKNRPIEVHRITDPLKKKKEKKKKRVSFEVEKMRMFLVQSTVRWCWALVRSW